MTDIFIKRPVLATVVSLIILLLGAQAFFSLPIRQYPKITSTTITITTGYPGASADTIQGFITTPIQQVVASTEGIDYLSSSSTNSTSTVNVVLKINADGDKALTEVLSSLNQVKNTLPSESNDPIVTKQTGDSTALMYIGFSSSQLTGSQITDYLTRVIQPRLQTVDGVASASILGGQTFSMRIWLNPKRMAALGVTPSDIRTALAANNFVSAPGEITGDYIKATISAATSPESARSFSNLIVASRDGTLIRLNDVAFVELAAESRKSSSVFGGTSAVFVGIYATPAANPLTVIELVRKELPDIQSRLPAGVKAAVAYDSTVFITASIDEVVTTLGEAALIVVVVIFLFLGNLRATLVPLVTIPLSLIGMFFLLQMLGFSVNLLTLLAMVLAIGLVVDDAIVVVENIYRHIEEGMAPREASLRGARDIAVPVISMTITLAAVYAPIGFIGGLTGALFREFAFALAGAVVISGIIALTLSPMMCSMLLTSNIGENGFVRWLDRNFGRLQRGYQRALASALNTRPLMVVVAVVVLSSCALLYVNTQAELAPNEDQGVVFMITKSPQYANLDYLEKFTTQLHNIFKDVPEYAYDFIINGSTTVNGGFAGIILKPWGDRKRSAAQIQASLQAKLNSVAGIQIFAFPPPSLPGTSGGPPLQFIIKTTADYKTLAEVLDRLQTEAQKSGMFIFIDSDLKFDNPQIDVTIDRSKANEIGVTMQDIGVALATMYGGNYVNRFNLYGRSYQVIPQVPREFRLNPDAINNVYVRTRDGSVVPLSTVVTIKTSIQPNALTTFQQLNSATIQAVMFPGRSLGEGLAYLKNKADEIFPTGFSIDYGGASRQFITEGNQLAMAFGFAIIVIFLVLAAQFESFRDPLIILISVPMSICGALIPMNLGLATINIYTQVGLVTLIGLISKHGILMVQFANELQEDEGLNRHDAIIKAAGIRLRPILMTTAAMVVAMVPLLIASGAGAKSRFDIGLVIGSGMTIGTCFTLFIVPTFYTLLARDRSTMIKDKDESPAPSAA